MKNPEPYNPLDKTHLGASVAEAMLRTPLEPLGGLEPFQGAGIYALYYHGGFEPYAPLVRDGAEAVPIYVGKAAPPGARQGKQGLTAYKIGRAHV